MSKDISFGWVEERSEEERSEAPKTLTTVFCLSRHFPGDSPNLGKVRWKGLHQVSNDRQISSCRISEIVSRVSLSDTSGKD